jgi:hypothetical protein
MPARQLKTHFSIILILFLIFIFIQVGCKESSTLTESFNDDLAGIAFEFPKGWSELTPKEWRERKMGENKTLITIMDKQREAGFSIIPVHLDATFERTFNMYADEGKDRSDVLIESIHAAGPNKYRGYKLLEKGEMDFAEYTLAGIEFKGQKPGKEMRWQRLVIAMSETDNDELVMIVFSTPVGKESDYEEDFKYIEDTWQWID